MSARERVLFLCQANAARSPMAAALAPLHWPGIEASSAGVRPIDEVHPYAVEVMREVGIDLSSHTPRHVEQVDPSTVDRVVVLCDADVRPAALLDKPFHHVPVADPALHAMEFSRAMALEAFRCAREDLEDALRALAARG